MNLYLIWQDINKDINTYDSAVVCAENKEDARMIHPDYLDSNGWDGKADHTWCEAKDVKVKLIGTSVKGIKHGVVCASFNAG